MPGLFSPLTRAALIVAALAIIALIVATLPTYADSAASCTLISSEGGSEYIVNSCNACRKVNIRRKRRGIAMPVMRTYNVQPRSKFPLSMKGPGRSRITSEIACEGEAGASQNLFDPKNPKVAEKKCVELKQTAAGGVVLVNSCGTCRGAAVERYAANGKPMGRQAYKLKPQSIVPVDPRGAAGVGYLTDVPCPS